MKVWRIKDNFNRQTRNHASRHDGNDLTLCGIALEGFEEVEPAQEVDGSITCTSCVGIIRYCKSIDTKDLRPNKD